MKFEDLVNTGKQLKEIRDYLVKCNKDRRLNNPKLEDAKALYLPIPDVIDRIRSLFQKGQITLKDAEILNKVLNSIKANYSEIKQLVSDESQELEIQVSVDENLLESLGTPVQNIIIQPSTSGAEINIQNSNMATFDLKVAIGLLPALDDTETKTLQLIDAIDLYSSMLSTDNDKKNLIKFVLKTRLTHASKIRLKSNYNTVDELLQDMRVHLLTRQSDTALQTQLSRSRQGDKTVQQFGKEIEDLFVNLTISQANGDDNAFKILKPINEKNAIKKFSDGLRSQRLSTVIAARNFSTLKDAIRSAQDEDTDKSTDTPQIFSMRNHRGSYRGSYNNNFQPNRGFWRGRGYTTGRFQRGARGQSQQYVPRGNASFRNNRGYGNGNYRGNGNSNGNFRGNQRYNNKRRSVNSINHIEANDEQEEKEKETINQFFRN